MVEEMRVLVYVLVRNGWGNACVSVCVCVSKKWLRKCLC